MIYLADEEGHLVQQELGQMVTSVLPGIYFVHFGREGAKHRVELTKDLQIEQGRMLQ